MLDIPHIDSSSSSSGWKSFSLYLGFEGVNNSVLKTESVSRTANLPPELVVLG